MKNTITTKITNKAAPNIKAITARAFVQRPTSIHPLLTEHVVKSLSFFSKFRSEKEEYLNVIFDNAFIYDIAAGIKVYADDKQIAGDTTWTETGKKNLLELKECLRITMLYASNLELQKKGTHVLPTTSNYMFYLWGNFIDNCPYYEDLIQKLFATSLIFVPLKNKKFSPYETSAFGQMWENIIFLIDDIQEANEVVK